MGDWKGYISAVLRDQRIDDVAIVGHSDNRCVWASRPRGLLAAISPQEVSVLTGPDRHTFLQTGLSVAGRRCCVIRDFLLAAGRGRRLTGCTHQGTGRACNLRGPHAAGTPGADGQTRRAWRHP